MSRSGRLIQRFAGSAFQVDPSQVAAVYVGSPPADPTCFSFTYSLLFGQWRAPDEPPHEDADMLMRLKYLKSSTHIKEVSSIEEAGSATAIILLR